MNQYEAMFLFDPTFGTTFEKCEGEIKRLLERAQAEILFCRKWEERRLAYWIKGRKRGVYVLVYFKAPPDRIAPLERDANLSEHILRLLVLRADGVTPEQMERAVRARGEQPARTGDEAKPDESPPEAKVSAEPSQADAQSEDVPEEVTTEAAVADVSDSEGAEAEEQP